VTAQRPVESTITPTAATQIARPSDKQPAALEALGLALLPTDQPRTKSAKEAHGRRRSFLRDAEPTISLPARYRRNPRPNAADTRPAGAQQEPTPSATPIPGTANRGTDFTQFTNQPVRDIVLDQPRRPNHVVVASHSEPIATKPKGLEAQTECRTNKNSTSPIHGNERDCGIATPVSAATEQVIAAGHIEPLATIADENPRPLATSSSMTSHPPKNGVKFLETITESAHPTIVKDGALPGESLRPRVTISAGEGQPVERIVVASPPAANPATDTVIQLNNVNSSIKIRAATEQVERIPVKPVNSVESN
jgi:hypothetical protein